ALQPVAAADEPAVAPAEEAKPVLIWRVARAERPVQQRPNFRAKNAANPVDGEAPKPRFERKPNNQTGEKPKFDKPKFDRSRFEKPKNQDGKSAGDAPGHQKFDKPKFDKPKFDKPKFDKPKFDKPKVEKPVDPDSPFAKLAALKERMKF
ncbi:MAG: hypothetical protein ACRCT6_09010, partial [Notoacmeibacter sp.]